KWKRHTNRARQTVIAQRQLGNDAPVPNSSIDGKSERHKFGLEYRYANRRIRPGFNRAVGIRKPYGQLPRSCGFHKPRLCTAKAGVLVHGRLRRWRDLSRYLWRHGRVSYARRSVDLFGAMLPKMDNEHRC